ncbi:MAG: serine/threonine-protein phosphatase [Salinivirgaceae bacterium]|nr:serine/threonine-protein phosphatase [Salinivirgaceae bacterium]
MLQQERSIRYQIVMGIVMPIFMVLSFITVMIIRYQVEQLDNTTLVQHNMVVSEMRSAWISYANQEEAKAEFEKQQLASISKRVVDKLVQMPKDVQYINLVQLCLDMGIDTSVFDICIVNRDGRVVNTSGFPRYNYNYFTDEPSFVKFFEQTFAKYKFRCRHSYFDVVDLCVKRESFQPILNNSYMFVVNYKSDELTKYYTAICNITDEQIKLVPNINIPKWYQMSSFPREVKTRSPFPQKHLKYIEKIEREGAITFTENRHVYSYFKFNDVENDIFKYSIISVMSNQELDQLKILWICLRLVVSLLFVFLFVYWLLMRKIKPIFISVDNLTNAICNMTETNQYGYLELSEYQGFENISQQINGLIDRVVAKRDEVISNSTVNGESEWFRLTSLLDIQNTMMSSPMTLSDVFEKSFLYNKPAQVVGGDFCWVAKVDNVRIVVVGDCSGGSAIGSAMSTICMAILQNIVNVQGVTEPSEIVTRLNDQLYNQICYSRNNMSIGVNISACSINNQRLTYFGARQTMLLVHDGRVRSIDCMQVVLGEKLFADMALHSVNVDLAKGDSIYLFTKGMAQQFNADMSEKFGFNRFRNTIKQLSTLPINERIDALDKQFNDWKNNGTQTDDMMVVGIDL